MLMRKNLNIYNEFLNRLSECRCKMAKQLMLEGSMGWNCKLICLMVTWRLCKHSLTADVSHLYQIECTTSRLVIYRQLRQRPQINGKQSNIADNRWLISLILAHHLLLLLLQGSKARTSGPSTAPTVAGLQASVCFCYCLFLIISIEICVVAVYVRVY